MLLRANRLRRTQEFRRVYERGRTLATPSFLFRFRRGDSGVSRIGIVISSRISKKATVRNRLRRQLRAVMRTILPQLPGSYDIVVSPRGLRQLRQSDILNECRNFLTRLHSRQR